MVSGNDVPRVKELLNPTLRALREAGHSASIQEIGERVTQNLQLPEDVTSQIWKKGPLRTRRAGVVDYDWQFYF